MRQTRLPSPRSMRIYSLNVQDGHLVYRMTTNTLHQVREEALKVIMTSTITLEVVFF